MSTQRRGTQRRGTHWRWTLALVFLLAILPGTSLAATGVTTIGPAAPVAGVTWAWGKLDPNLAGADAVLPGSDCTLAVPPPGKGEPPAPEPGCVVRVPGLPGIVALAAGLDHTLALDADGRVWAWGDDSSGQLGDGPGAPDRCGGQPCAFAPVRLPTPTEVVALAAGNAYSLALRADGTVWAWGSDEYGELGDGSSPSAACRLGIRCETSPVQVRDLVGVAAIAAGSATGLALRADGTVWAWGDDDFGQLGDGPGAPDTCRFGTTDYACTTSPVQVRGLAGITAIGAGATHGLAADSAGHVWAWGSDSLGELGDGPGGPDVCPFFTATDPCATSPVPVAGLADIVAVVGGWYHSLAINRVGDVWAWGRGDLGQVGNGRGGAANVRVDRPVPISGLTDVIAVAAGELHSLALRRDGTVWAWGSNRMGQLGRTPGETGTCGADAEPCLASPQPIRGLSGVVVIASGAHHGLAVVAGAAAPSAIPSPAPSTAPLPGLPPTGGGALATPAPHIGRPPLLLAIALALASAVLVRPRWHRWGQSAAPPAQGCSR